MSRSHRPRTETEPIRPMARFTFGAGNAGKLLRLPLYLLGALITLVVPRDRGLWVAGCGIGVAEGAVPVVDAARRLLRGQVRVVWLARDAAELTAATERGWEAVPRSGWRGFWLTLRARVAIVTHGFGDVNRYAVRGATVVQLWHGIPLKRLHLDTPAALRVSFLPDHPLVRRMMAIAYRRSSRMIALFPVSSALVGDRIRTAFGLRPEQLAVTGDPRDDVLLAGDPDQRRARARDVLRTALGELPQGRVVLYAPTWRDGAPDPAVPSAADWRTIGGWLADADATLLVRTHPLGTGGYREGPETSQRIRLLGSDLLADATAILPAVDDLVTDYSSIAYDFALTGGRSVFLAPDLEQYAKSRGLYESYRDFSGGRHVTNWPEVLLWLDEDPALSAPHTAWLVGQHVDLLDGRATERVLAETLRRAGYPPSAELADAASAVPTERPAVLAAEFAVGDRPRLELRLRLTGRLPAPRLVRLEGVRGRVEAPLLSDPVTGEVRASLPLVGRRWGRDGLALPSGDYRMLLLAEGAEPSGRLLPGPAEVALTHPLFRAELRANAGGVILGISPPLREDEIGRRAQRGQRDRYLRAVYPTRDAVFFESFYGRSASDNPAGIDRAVARLRPDLDRYWSVVDASVPVPDGAIPVIEGSREWWDARGSARLLVVNDWLRLRWRRRPQQRVLQTWHGTMIKRLAIDRPRVGLRTLLAVLRERARWDILLTQNSYAAEIFRSAYAFRDPIWLEGYPRNDVLIDGDPGLVRARLGIPPGARVVLYAPTWRDDRTEMVDYLDLESFADQLPAGDVLLVRGHSRTLPYGRDLEASRLLDVTTYPDVAELLLVADVLVTDYSSVMFDFASTGRPTIFYTPDLDHYSQELRGFYFDLIAEAPGPVVDSKEALLEVLAHLERRAAVFEGARIAWRERFTPHDDGLAGERVVRRLIDEGYL